MLSKYQLSIYDSCKKLVPNLFLVDARIKNKKDRKDGKALYKLMSNAVYGKIMANVKNRIDVRLLNNEKTI